MADVEEYNQQKPQKTGKQHNVLPIWGNEQTMNLNPLILANIQGSSYFKVHLFKLKTYHEVVDEIYYQVKHLEPWERGSRKTAGQTGMCGGVRGVGAGGIVSTAFCLLYKLYTLRLTRKQLNGLLTHTDSPYIRALGFMYIRYTQPPADLMDWYEEYFEDQEEIEPRAGGGGPTTIGVLVRQMLTKLDWFSTLFPRIPVPIQKIIENKLAEYNRNHPPVVKTAQNFRGVGGAGGGGAGSGAREGYNRGDNGAREGYSRANSGAREAYNRGDNGAREGYSRANSGAREGYNRGDNGAREGYSRASSGARESYNPRAEPDRREHDDRDRRDYSDNDRYSKDRFKRDDRDRDRDRDRTRDRDRDAARDRDRDATRDRDRDATRDRDRDATRDRERHRERRDRPREPDRRHRSRSRDRRHK